MSETFNFNEFWTNLKDEAQKEWALAEKDLESIDGDFDKFVDSVKEKFDLNKEEAREKAEKLYNEFDELKWEGTEEMIKGKAQELWGDISDNDWESIKGSKTKIIGYLKHNFGKTGQEALKDLDKLLK